MSQNRTNKSNKYVILGARSFTRNNYVNRGKRVADGTGTDNPLLVVGQLGRKWTEALHNVNKKSTCTLSRAL